MKLTTNKNVIKPKKIERGQEERNKAEWNERNTRSNDFFFVILNILL